MNIIPACVAYAIKLKPYLLCSLSLLYVILYVMYFQWLFRLANEWNTYQIKLQSSYESVRAICLCRQILGHSLCCSLSSKFYNHLFNNYVCTFAVVQYIANFITYVLFCIMQLIANCCH